MIFFSKTTFANLARIIMNVGEDNLARFSGGRREEGGRGRGKGEGVARELPRPFLSS